VTVLTIEKLGRKWIQIQGFLLAALFRTCPLDLFLIGMPDDGLVAILAGRFHSLSKVAFIVNFTLLQVCNRNAEEFSSVIVFAQFFFNFGANATTYVMVPSSSILVAMTYAICSVTPPSSSQPDTVPLRTASPQPLEK
jgi:PHS family inorganic phosphate transporter-like MFS transporter